MQRPVLKDLRQKPPALRFYERVAALRLAGKIATEEARCADTAMRRIELAGASE
jgi:hypothetical protein